VPSNPVPLSRDLLDVAREIALIDGNRPRQAALRRAVSTAYYGIFHLLVGEARKVTGPAAPAGLRRQIARAFTHATMKQVCAAFATGRKQNLPRSIQSLIVMPMEDELVEIADLFVELQELRHSADYDLTARFARLDVLRLIRRARRRSRDWARVRRSDNSKVFLSALLLNSLWRHS
jgi:hypothetical protein